MWFLPWYLSLFESLYNHSSQSFLRAYIASQTVGQIMAVLMPASLIPTETASRNIWDQYRRRKSCYLRLRSCTWFEIQNLRNSCSASDKMCLQSTESSGWITKYKDSGKQVFAVWSSIAFYSSDWLCSQDNLAVERGLSISISENNWKFSENMRNNIAIKELLFICGKITERKLSPQPK